MANRNWARTAPGYAAGYGGVQGNIGYFMGAQPQDKRGYANNVVRYQSTAAVGATYRNDYYKRSERRDDFRGAKRPVKGRSPVIERRPIPSSFPPKKDNRPFGKRTFGGNYEVRLPKSVFGTKTVGIVELRQRFNRLNMPNDFFEADNMWIDAFPLNHPLQLSDMSDFHAFHRDVENPNHIDTSSIEIPDADYSYSARVMLIGCPPLAELYKSCCRSADEPITNEKSPPSKNISFLIGGRVKNETFAIGGPWSPSLDGPNPSSNPQTLINTAIRTFKGFTGIDLSLCTHWTRFLQIKYYRTSGTKAPVYTTDQDDREITENKPEVVVFFIPNISHLIPSEEEWNKTKEVYNNLFQKLMNPEEEVIEKEVEKEVEVTNDAKDGNTSQNADASIDEGDDVERSSSEPTHYSKLEVNTMKVPDLRNELAARNLESKGLKAQLQTRLQTALDEEKSKDTTATVKAEDETKTEQTPTKTATPAAAPAQQEKDDSKQLSDKDRRRLERLYRLGDRPSILIHPNKAARGGRFDCHRVSLHTLLDYRTDEMKETNFEVALFAEQFNEMMQRDSAFSIFKAICIAPEKEQKSEINGKTNGTTEEADEPDLKRRRAESVTVDNEDGDTQKVRKIRRTVRPALLFAFTYFDTGYAGYIREHDLCDMLHLLGLHYSKGQLKSMVSKVIGRRDSVQFRALTDSDVVEGDDNDVISLENHEKEDAQQIAQLAVGNRSLFGQQAPVPSTIVLGGSDLNAVRRVEVAESMKKKLEYQFFLIKDELEKTRARLNGCKDIEDKLRAENVRLMTQFKDEQKQCHELRHLYNTYSHLVRLSRDHMDRALTEITKQFDKEKAKRDAERAAAEAEKAKAEGRDAIKEENKDATETSGTKLDGATKTEEKDWEVVDTV